jgi:hypothetical protein
MPDRLGPYRLLERIGEGGMGVVHRAQDEQDRVVAIKVLRPGVAADPDARRRLGREFETMQRVRSPFVAEVIDADVTGDIPYVVTRYVVGHTLDQAVRQDGPLRGRALERLAWGLAEGLAAVHAAGVVHRDLKPANVVMASGVPVLIDFGIAQPPDATRITQVGMFMGTPGYLAPEVVEGHPSGPPADVHSWGSTVAYAATGRPPYGTGSYESIFYRIVSGQPDVNGIPAPLMPLVTAALSREPGRRPSAIQLSTDCAALDLSAEPAVAIGGGVAAAAAGIAASPGLAGGAAGLAGGSAAAPGTLMDRPAISPGAAGSQAAAATQLPVPAAPPRSWTRQLPGPRGPDDYADLLPPVSYDVAAAAAGTRNGANGSTSATSAGPASAADKPADKTARTGSRLPRLLSLATMVIAVAASILAPVAGMVVALVTILLLRTAERARDGLFRRRAARGARASDVFVSVITTPWALLRALLATVLLAPLALTAAAVAAAVTLIAAPSYPAAGGYAAGAFIAFYAFGPGSKAPRRQLTQMLGGLTRSRLSAGLAASVLTVLALAGAAAAISRPHDFWPASGLSWHWPALRHLASTVQSRLQHL